MLRRNTKGFTLIELLIVVVIIGILAAVAIPKFANTKEKAARSSAIADLRNLATAQESFFADSNRYGNAADTTAMRFNWSRGALGTAITGNATGWAAEVNINGTSPVKKCGMFVGAATRPTFLPATVAEGQPACQP